MSLAEMMTKARPTEAGFTLDVPESWKQGRTVYGGLSAALCLHGALPHAGGRPLRSAQISFVGPSEGEIEVTAEKLREGRTACSVRSRLTSQAGIGLETVFTFCGERESALSLDPAPMPARATAPTEASERLTFPEGAPGFTRNFDFIWAGGGIPFLKSGKAVVRMWARHKDRASRTHPLSLMCIGDVLPPALTPMLDTPTPLSSMTWMMDLLTDAPETADGWWLLECRADHVRGGLSTQDMTIWNTEGACMVKGRQMVTVFA
ncbi:thioesterase family protein [Oceanicaulis sp.]|uniref:thioesterase family protein n=1 Tax=Oceanicaulis sp. TaxID=1924941 RepID=UPI003BAC00D6